MLFLCRKCCLLQCCCVIFMQIVLILCKLCCFYANCEVFMQIVLFWCKLWHLSQFTLFCRKWHFCREIRALAGTFGSAIRRLLLLMMSATWVKKERRKKKRTWVKQKRKKYCRIRVFGKSCKDIGVLVDWMRAETLDKGNQVFCWSKIFMKAFCCKQLLGGC